MNNCDLTSDFQGRVRYSREDACRYFYLHFQNFKFQSFTKKEGYKKTKTKIEKHYSTSNHSSHRRIQIIKLEFETNASKLIQTVNFVAKEI